LALSPDELNRQIRRAVHGSLVALKLHVALLDLGRHRIGAVPDYTATFVKQERVDGALQDLQTIQLKLRHKPFSVYMKWIGKESNGREVVFVKGQHEDKIHTLVAAGDVPLVAAGKHMSFAVDSILVRANTRHPITEAGLGSIIERFAHVVEQSEQGDPRAGTLKYLGLIKRPEFEAKGEAVLHVIPPRVDPLLPGGGQRLLFFDAALHLPVLVVTQDEAGREVEYYCHDRFLIPGRLDDADFDPSRWDKSTK